jgi:hypothetical protein
MGKTFSKGGESVRSVKFKEAEVDDEDFDEVDEDLGDEDDEDEEDEEIVERVKGVFADQPPEKGGGRKRAKTA